MTHVQQEELLGGTLQSGEMEQMESDVRNEEHIIARSDDNNEEKVT